jgi:magnesium chelatase subunit I
MSIANCENMVSNAERRGLLTGEDPVVPRISDLAFLAASSRGKLELTMTEDDGREDAVIAKLVGEAVKNLFDAQVDAKQLRGVVDWFEAGHSFVVGDHVPSADYVRKLNEVPALKKEVAQLVKKMAPEEQQQRAGDALAASAAEFLLEGLHVSNRLNKATRGGETVFKR